MKSSVKLGAVVEISPEFVSKDYPHGEIDYIDISSVGSGTLRGTTKIPIDKTFTHYVKSQGESNGEWPW